MQKQHQYCMRDNITMRYISANATLSNINTTEFGTDNSQKPDQAILSTPNVNYIDNTISSQQVNNVMKKDKQNTIDEKSPSKDTIEKKSSMVADKVPVSKLSIIAIALTICLGGFIYFHGHQQSVAQKQTIALLQSEVDTLKTKLQYTITQDVTNSINTQNQQLALFQQKVATQLDNQSQSQKQFIDKVNDSLKITEQNLLNLNEQLAAMSTTNNNIWLISQANYLVNLAGRKIWNEQDYVTARLLLKTADSSLAQANDPSLLPARQAINNDISTLAKISYIDFDGIIMTIMGLADSITELPLIDHYQEIDLGMTQHDDTLVNQNENSNNNQDVKADTTQDETSTSITASWSDNLMKSAKSFLENFIQVEKYDSFGECIANAGQDVQLLEQCQVHKALITPEQSLYLRENIRLRLFIAAQAVPRHQDLIFQRALNDVSIWVNAYFDGNTSSVKTFLDELGNLQQQSIRDLNVPEQLSSKNELDKLMQTRVRSMLAN